ncbi:probable membrane-associated kinase regulator 2 [Solanum pennellii]|uniref:Probable membrane-associated kinase regulator 2 n=1 Tax=Solanum pennellii TaxID=28526 RepID=A0ABM1HDM9_SOLPN|nr:probable membrane-associated kinase regulator 2 [Solanum pennellii]
MEAFSLLKYWRGGGAAGVFSDDAAGAKTRSAVLTEVSVNSSESDSDEDGEVDGDDGPFFDLEFTALPEEEEVKVEGNDRCKISSKKEEEENEEGDVSESENEEELKFTLSPSSSSVDGTDPNVSLSPSDDLFFKGSLVPIEPSSLLLTASEANSKFSSSLLKSATKFRVLMLKLKKPKSNAATKTGKLSEGDGDGDDGSVSATPKPLRIKVSEDEKEERQNRTQSKFLTVKLKVEEVPIKSLFTRDNSSKANNSSSKTQKRNPEEAFSTNAAISSSDEKKFSKDVMQKYLKKVKPLYIRVSKRYGEKLKFSGQLSFTGNAALKPGPSPPPSATAKAEPASDAPQTAEKNQKQGNIPSGLRVVRKRLGKSRSASSAVIAASPVASNRRDDSLLQQQDAIQGAILHCKRSFNSSRDSESSILSRSASDASHEKSTHLTTDSSALEEAIAVRKLEI